MPNPLLVTLIALVTAYILSQLFRYFKLPGVVGQVLTGILLGLPFIRPYLFTEEVSSVFTYITNIGIILMFFFVGLEISVKDFKKNFKESSLIALFNTLIPLVSGFVVGKYLFSLDAITSLIIGISLAVSSQAISLDILEELKLLRTRVGTIILESGTVDDVFEVLLISVLVVVFHTTITPEKSFTNVLIDIVLFLCAVMLFKRVLIPYILKVCSREKSKVNLFTGALIIVLLLAYLSELFGISSLIGALVAGVLLRQTFLTGDYRKPWIKNELSHSVHVIAFGFLIPLFFVTVGLQMDLSAVSSNILLVAVLLVIDIVGTWLGTFIGVMLSKGTFRESLLVGWGVIPKGDTELVIATIALNNGLIDSDIYTAIITVALITTFVAPIVFKMLVKKYHGVRV